MKLCLVYLSATLVLVALWFHFDAPFVDALVFLSSVLLTACAVVLMLARRSMLPALIAGLCGTVLLLGFRYAAMESAAAARSEFASIANESEFCALVANVKKGRSAWIEDRDGQFSVHVSRLGASNRLILKTGEQLPELRLVSIVGEQQMFRMRLGDCQAAP